MSSDEEALAIGRIIKEYQAAKSTQAALDSELRRIGSVLELMGTSLKFGKFSKEPFRQENLFALDINKILSLIDEANLVSERVASLKKQIGALGINP